MRMSFKLAAWIGTFSPFFSFAPFLPFASFSFGLPFYGYITTYFDTIRCEKLKARQSNRAVRHSGLSLSLSQSLARTHRQCLYLSSPFIWFYFILFYLRVLSLYIDIFASWNVCSNNLDSIGFSVFFVRIAFSSINRFGRTNVRIFFSCWLLCTKRFAVFLYSTTISHTRIHSFTQIDTRQ